MVTSSKSYRFEFKLRISRDPQWSVEGFMTVRNRFKFIQTANKIMKITDTFVNINVCSTFLTPL